jgi:5'-AMP-activated protein kinase regulatory beta subunit
LWKTRLGYFRAAIF